MKPRHISLPLLAAIAATRGMLGAGIGLLVSGRISEARRRNVGRTLLSVGIASTVPLLWRALRGGRRSVTQVNA
jgi:hypothetical protein